MLALWISNPQQRSYMTLICVLLLRRRAEDVGSVESPSRALQPDLGIAHFRPKADNLWYHCNVQIKLVNGLAVATAAPNLGDLRAARWRGLMLSNSQAIFGPPFHDSWCRQDMGNSLSTMPLANETFRPRSISSRT